MTWLKIKATIRCDLVENKVTIRCDLVENKATIRCYLVKNKVTIRCHLVKIYKSYYKVCDLENIASKLQSYYKVHVQQPPFHSYSLPF